LSNNHHGGERLFQLRRSERRLSAEAGKHHKTFIPFELRQKPTALRKWHCGDHPRNDRLSHWSITRSDVIQGGQMVGSLGHLEIPLPDRLWVCETCMQQRESTHHLTAIWSRDRMPIPASQNGFEMRIL